MLQDKYGRLIIVGVFVVIGVILLLAPGLNSKNKSVENDQLNFTSMPKEVEKNGESQINEQISDSQAANRSSVQQVSLSPEEDMLDAWGMRKPSANSSLDDTSSLTPPVEQKVNDEPQNNIPPQDISPKERFEKITENISNSLEQPKAKSEKSNTSVIKVNGKCFAPPVSVKSLTKSECEDPKNNVNIKSCPADDSVEDNWAAAYKACGNHLQVPDINDLLAVARILYGEETISLNVTEQSKYKAYGKYSPIDGTCDGFKHEYLKYNPVVAAEYGFPVSPGYNIWGRLEISPKYGLGLMYNEKSVEYNSCTLRSFQPSYAMCQIPCK